MAMDALGNFVVAWMSALQDGSGYGVYAQRYNAAAGVAPGSRVQVNTYTTGNQEIPLDCNGFGEGTMWSHGRSADQDGSGYGIYAQRYLLNHAPVRHIGDCHDAGKCSVYAEDGRFRLHRPERQPAEYIARGEVHVAADRREADQQWRRSGIKSVCQCLGHQWWKADLHAECRREWQFVAPVQVPGPGQRGHCERRRGSRSDRESTGY